MTAPALMRLVLALAVVGCCAARQAGGRVDLWPMPASVSRGARTLYVARDLKLTTAGTGYKDGKAILADAFRRMVAAIQLDHAINGSYDGLPVLAGVNVAVRSPDDELKFGVDESYRLTVPSTGSPLYARIEAQTVYGALHALETFSQLCYFDFILSVTGLHWAPWTIVDKPRFPYRGLLIDTARHYLPVPVIKSVIDSMAYSKLNVLHWHIVDEQSFPLEIPSYPKLSNGAYSYSEKYTINDAIDIVQYAERRGVNVLAEIDVPGHAGSWGVGYPSLWPSATCQQPLDVSSEFTFKVIDGILSDFSKVFKFKFVHLGGDEVDTSCWTTTPRIKSWLVQHGMNESDAYRYFVLRAQKIAISHGYEIINWEETFNNFGDKLDRKTVVHNWLGGGVAEKVVSVGLRCIVSNQDKWYLDHLDATWEGFYMNEPLTNIYNPEQQKLILGGEVCMWGEHIDASDIQQTIWPRAAAAAERLWTPVERLAKNPTAVTARLAHFRCLLNERGVAAAPLAGYGRTAPSEPGSCMRQ
ncbi:beta-hexosaminidase 3-like [Hordeum vulgare subsp. vulgare]|uniref:Beta-hexosaminidase n=1 Tax=Hordeum vulgare subsp. vulgare TaxID=112509 RepID=A0A287FZE3_HORVV|nr:beta-hexosaminidase 3-like [Hordeum vulgare subsp. vulgare]XP_044975046.1 beta-hexosaminidase 3-like [Hordeum vulgare subsp. vulgare]